MSDLHELLNIISLQINKQLNIQDEFSLTEFRELFVTEAKKNISNTKDGFFISDELLTNNYIFTNGGPQSYDIEEKLLSIFSTNIEEIKSFMYTGYGITFF